MKVNSEQEMIQFGADFLHKFPDSLPIDNSLGHSPKSKSSPTAQTSTVIELIGDVGTGKTTFVRGLAQALGIKDPISSPSFTISRAYACADGRTLVHYDFYRLNDPGLMSEDLLENLENPHNIVVMEWSDSVKNLLPENHTTIYFRYNDDGSREVEIT